MQFDIALKKQTQSCVDADGKLWAGVWSEEEVRRFSFGLDSNQSATNVGHKQMGVYFDSKTRTAHPMTNG